MVERRLILLCALVTIGAVLGIPVLLVRKLREVDVRPYLVVVMLLASSACGARAQRSLPPIEFSTPAEIVLRAAVAAGEPAFYCARSVSTAGRTLVSHLTAPVVSHRRRRMICPVGYDVLVRTQTPGAPCGFSDQERAVFALGEERLRILVCRDQLAFLHRPPAHPTRET